MNFRVGETEAASVLVRTHHYSKRWPAMVQVVGTWHADGGLFGDRGECVAACVFGLPPARWRASLWELSRLVRAPHVNEPLTGLISATCDHIRRRKLIDLLVSYADATQNHHGGIYQAASWNYHAQRPADIDGLFVDGRFIPARSCNALWGTNSAEKLRSLMPEKVVEPHYAEGKHLYWRALSRSGERKAAALGLDRAPYPKPTKEAAAA